MVSPIQNINRSGQVVAGAGATSDAAVLGYLSRMSKNYNDQINELRNGMEARFQDIQDVNKRLRIIGMLKSMAESSGNTDKKIDSTGGTVTTVGDDDRSYVDSQRTQLLKELGLENDSRFAGADHNQAANVYYALEAAGINPADVGVSLNAGVVSFDASSLDTAKAMCDQALQKANSDNQMGLTTMNSLMAAKNADFTMVKEIMSADNEVRKTLIRGIGGA